MRNIKYQPPQTVFMEVVVNNKSLFYAFWQFSYNFQYQLTYRVSQKKVLLLKFQVFDHMIHSGPFRTILDHSRQFRNILDLSGLLGPLGQFWTVLDHYGFFLDPSEPILPFLIAWSLWTVLVRLDRSGPFLPFWTIMDCLDCSGSFLTIFAVLDRFGPFGTF